MACVANRSTTVRNAVSPMTSERTNAVLIRGCAAGMPTSLPGTDHDRTASIACAWKGMPRE
jgi:hypothetical protein